MTQITDYHSKLFAHELLRRYSAADDEKMAGTLLDARVDLNPHQVEAALFAFNNPFSKGAILADEVGLGKTIEAGLVLAQKWSEGKRRVLIICPASLRKQWQQEMEEKFYLPSKILEGLAYNKAVKAGNSRPFEQSQDAPAITICSFQFANSKHEDVMRVPWDLIVVDEAHRLRNVYKTTSSYRTLRTAIANRNKILLTATPLQNSLMELYGLVSFIDEHVFGDQKSFRAQYARGSESGHDELQTRLRPLCKRTLRRQVLEYIRYTNRIPLTQEFTPFQEEQRLYDLVSAYLQRPQLAALPSGQRALMVLILRKLLASSTFAIAGALQSLARRLQRQLKDDAETRRQFDENPDDLELVEDFDGFGEIADEWGGIEEDESAPALLTRAQREVIETEIAELHGFSDLAESIAENAKGTALVQALETGLAQAADRGAAKKALIFTESRRTQAYLVKLLNAHGYDQLVLFNGTNNDAQSRAIYARWKADTRNASRLTSSRTADMRAALVDHFKNSAEIMIATEAAAEGINLQFCSMIVNYDLPWNPQRIEQRIGRCHRYGQKHDVVVINFLNKANAADQRVFELLQEKFQLFDGVFGASDEVLGTIEGGVDFERRVAEIYQSCRDPEEIEAAFKALRAKMDASIQATLDKTRGQLLEHFDADVHDLLKVRLDKSQTYLDKFMALLWRVTAHELRGKGQFDAGHYTFILKKPIAGAALGGYHLGKEGLEGQRYRLGHPLAQHVVGLAAGRKQGQMMVRNLSSSGADAQDHILIAARCDDGTMLDPKAARRLFDLPSEIKVCDVFTPDAALVQFIEAEQQTIRQNQAAQRASWIAQESTKLETWAEDLVQAAERDLDDAKRREKELKRALRHSTDPSEQHRYNQQIQEIERSKRRMRQEIFKVEDEILARRDAMIEETRRRLDHSETMTPLFTLRWMLI